MIEIDGSEKSGSGIIVRYCLTLAGLLHQNLRIYNIRAKRKKLMAMNRGVLFTMFVFLVCHCVNAQGDEEKGGALMKLTSPSFGHNQLIPKKFTCDGDDINPTLEIQDIPAQAQSLALIVDDPDAPMGTWVHWVVYDIPVISTISENSIPGKQGNNNFGRKDYGGPCPPSGTHRYFFKLYALDKKLEAKEGLNKQELEKAMQGHILDKAELIGLYKRSR